MRALLVAALLLLAALAVAAPADGERRIASDLATPAELAFRGDGALLFAELATGRVKAIADEGAAPSQVARVDASGGGNGGFTGLAVDPADGTTLFVVYSAQEASAPHGKVQRVSRISNGDETVLLDDIPWAEFHVGGRIAVGPDGFLYVTTGDNGGPDGDDYTRLPGSHPGDPVQDPHSLVGKVLRLSKGGAAAGSVPGWNPYVYAMGFRNPFGLAFGPDGTLYAAENGITHDEVNVILQGRNYGWPACEGNCERYQKPLATFPDSFGTTGLAYLGGKLYLGDFNGDRLRVVDAATGAMDVGWATDDGSPLGVAAGPDGCLYVSTFTSIFQVDAAGAGACNVGPEPPPATTTTVVTTTPPATTTAPPPTTTTTPPVTTTEPPPTTTTTPPPVTTTAPPPVTTTDPPPGATTTTTTQPPATTTEPTPSSPPSSTLPPPSESVAPTTRDPIGSANESTEQGQVPGPHVVVLLAALVAAALVLRRR